MRSLLISKLLLWSTSIRFFNWLQIWWKEFCFGRPISNNSTGQNYQFFDLKIHLGISRGYKDHTSTYWLFPTFFCLTFLQRWSFLHHLGSTELATEEVKQLYNHYIFFQYTLQSCISKVYIFISKLLLILYFRKKMVESFLTYVVNISLP